MWRLRDQKKVGTDSGNAWAADTGGRVASGFVGDTAGNGRPPSGSQDPGQAEGTATSSKQPGISRASDGAASPGCTPPAGTCGSAADGAGRGGRPVGERVDRDPGGSFSSNDEPGGNATNPDPAPDRGAHAPARGAGGGSRDLDDNTATTAVMTKAEKKLCRRGIAAVRQEEGVCDSASGSYGVDVLMLQHDPDEHILTAVGLSSSSVFDDVQPCDLRRTTAANEVLAKVRKLRPRMLMIRTPDHMTRTKGGPHIVRTYTARHRMTFTKLVVACCAEQLCEGRLFCIEEVNDSMSERVREWKRMMGDDRVMCVQRHDDDSSWRMYTNSRHVRDEAKKCWLNQREWRDPRGFMKDMAAGVLRDRQGVHEVHVAHCVYAVEELRRETGVDERKVMTILRRCHENLGHPSPARMNMLLKAAHASERVLQLARSLECETCAALSKPKAHNVTKMRRATEFNQQVCVDTFELDVRDSKMHFLNIVDEATGYQLCVPLWKGMQAKVVRNAYRKGWKRWAGAPVRLFSDGGKEFEGEFEHGLSLDGTYGDTSAAYAPWQNGTAERKGDVWKTAFAKAQLEVRPRSKQEVQELIDQINTAVNSMSRKDGYSPHQHVFGKDVRIPGMITSDADPVINSSLAQGESVFERRMNMRTAARKAFLDADGDARIRKAMEHRSRPERGPFEEGQLVYFWRRNRFENRHHWHGPAVVIGKNGRSKVWVAKGTKVYRCCPEQLRRLSPDQEAMVKLLPEDMVHVRDNVSARGAGNYHDISGLEVPPDVASTDEGNEHRGDDAERSVGSGAGMELEVEPEVMPSSNPSVVASPAVPIPRVVPDEREVEPGMESPSKRARIVTPLTEALRRDLNMLDRGQSSGASVASAGPSGAEQLAQQVPVPGSDEADEDLEVLMTDSDHWLLDHGRKKLIRVHVMERRGAYVPCKLELPVEVSCVGHSCRSVVFSREGGKIVHEYDWTGDARSLPVIKGPWTGTTEFELADGWAWCSKSHECFEVKAKKGRKELTEADISHERQSGLNAAKAKEWNKLVSSGAIVVHEGNEARRLKESVPRKRILKSRFVLTEADQGTSPQTQDIKARWCIRGYLDPDLLELDTSSPTLSMEGFSIALQLMASHGWSVNIADVEGAFLRGDSLSPTRGRLFIDPPPGGVPGLSEGCLIEAVKTVYGLADAPKAWWECFSSKLASLGMRVSKFDPCMFYYYHERCLSGVVAVHVDDLCLGGDKYFHEHVVRPLKKLFPFKHWKVGSGEFLGKQVQQQADGSIKISQCSYAQQQQGLNISRERKRDKQEPITEDERQQMRGVLGSINWLVTGSRPDLGAWCSLLQQRVNSATVADLIDVNKLVSLTHDNCSPCVWVKSIPVSELQFVMLSDAAWANAQGLCSQAGYMIAACDKRLSQGEWGTFSVLCWKSYKQDRQTHSTLGAELLALSRGIAEARWVRSMWCEAVNYQYDLRRDGDWSNKLPITAVIDCKPVYDHTQSATVAVKDKRMAIEMLLVKADMAKHQISLRWMATKQMIVDVLTKKGAPMNLFRKVLAEGRFILIEDEAVVRVTSKKDSTTACAC